MGSGEGLNWLESREVLTVSVYGSYLFVTAYMLLRKQLHIETVLPPGVQQQRLPHLPGRDIHLERNPKDGINKRTGFKKKDPSIKGKTLTTIFKGPCIFS
uniref:Uncharacterized protein n=1 Tax=Electrophorus electricus TaxID=8005 RepID=A0AAY5ECV3_ELEEL